MTSRRKYLHLCSIVGIGAFAGCIGNPEAQATKVVPKNGNSGGRFGRSVAVSSDATTAIIGAPGDEDPNGEVGGLAYVYDGNGGSWSQQATLTPDDGVSKDRFGQSVAVSSDGTTAIIGAPGDGDPNGEAGGSAYVFEASDKSWSQQAKLAPDDVDSTDRFGYALAMSGNGNTIIIGARNDNTANGRQAGSAYVFKGIGGSWSQQVKLVPDDGDRFEWFGRSVAVSSDGTTAIIGALLGNGQSYEGSAYVFKASNGSWSQAAKFEGGRIQFFGGSVAVSSDGSTTIIGANIDPIPNGEGAGSAYVFQATDGSWSEQAKLTPDDGDTYDRFGRSVAMSDDGNIAIIGAPGDEDPNGEEAGSTYVFDSSDGAWSERRKLTAGEGDSKDQFGRSVAVSGDGSTAIVGAYKDEDPNGEEAGSAYVYSV